jgi:hypothetical protein
MRDPSGGLERLSLIIAKACALRDSPGRVLPDAFPFRPASSCSGARRAADPARDPDPEATIFAQSA